MSDINSEPKVYVCHAAEDKSFVTQFKAGARKLGVDILDARPGDDAVSSADTVVVIVSKSSIVSSQVRAELNIALKRHMASQCKLLPIIIYDGPVPVSLQTIASYKIEDIVNWQGELPRIVHNFLGVRPSGSRPDRSSRFSVSLPAITELLLNDILVLFDICEQFRASGRLDGSFVGAKQLPKYHITGPMYNESLGFLFLKGHIRGQKTTGGAITAVGPTLETFKMFADHSIPDFDKHTKTVIRYAVQQLSASSSSLKAEDVIVGTSVEPIIVDYVYRLLGQKKLASVSFALGGAREIIGVTPQLTAWAGRP